MFHESAKFHKLTDSIPKTYRYKGLQFPLHEASLISISNEVENGGRVTTIPLYAFFGQVILNPAQIRERVDSMIKSGLHAHKTVSAAVA